MSASKVFLSRFDRDQSSTNPFGSRDYTAIALAVSGQLRPPSRYPANVLTDFALN
ncbi:MAG TPA: hypothetical protein VGY55_08755 [Pirellulales bacterium]|jgi:hypothetical protein|nr:hypothetical protein [Pirellulales bacterium]